jgi:hypothetical protein
LHAKNAASIHSAATQREHVRHRRQKHARIAQRRVGHGAPDIGPLQWVVRDVVVALPVVAVAVGENVNVLEGKARRQRKLRAVQEQRGPVAAVIRPHREPLETRAQRAAQEGRGEGARFHLGPGIKRLMKFVSKLPA